MILESAIDSLQSIFLEQKCVAITDREQNRRRVCDKAENMQHVLEVPPLPPQLNGPEVGSKTPGLTQ